MPLAPNAHLGRYEIRSKIGEGGMGEVYRARDPKLGREVAIKVLPAAFSADKERLSRFEQEAQAAGALNHPNILTVYDVDTHDGSPYVVSELLEGETLRERLGAHASNVPLPQRKAIDYALQIAHGLSAAHEKGIVHRDLKPENLFITKDGRVKILDFGLAKLLRPRSGDVDTEAATMHAHTDPGVVLGTVGYMSPEQVRGQRVDHRSDIFSFGTVFYEMLSGRRAFHGQSAVETMSAILKEDPPELTKDNAAISPALEQGVRHCLEKNPEERFQSARDLAFAINSLSGLSSGASVTRAAGVTLPSRRWRLQLIVFPLVILAALAGGLFLGKPVWKISPPALHQITFRSGTIFTARFAPDGQTIVYGAAWEGKPSEVFSARTDSPELRPLGAADASLLSISANGEMALLLHPEALLVRIADGTLVYCVQNSVTWNS